MSLSCSLNYASMLHAKLGGQQHDQDIVELPKTIHYQVLWLVPQRCYYGWKLFLRNKPPCHKNIKNVVAGMPASSHRLRTVGTRTASYTKNLHVTIRYNELEKNQFHFNWTPNYVDPILINIASTPIQPQLFGQLQRRYPIPTKQTVMLLNCPTAHCHSALRLPLTTQTPFRT